MTITIPMCPTGTNHAYHTNQGKWYKDQRVKDWETECLWILKKYNTFQFRFATSVEVCFLYGNKRKNDIDGRIKPVLDILQKAMLIENDSQITDLVVRKRYDKENPRIEIELSSHNI